MSILGGDRNINEVLELLSVDAACAGILPTQTKETVLCAASCVNIEISQLKETTEQAGSFLSLFFALSTASVLFDSASSLVPLLPLSLCINVLLFYTCLTITHLYHSSFLFQPAPISVSVSVCFSHLNLSWRALHFLSSVLLLRLTIYFFDSILKGKRKLNAII